MIFLFVKEASKITGIREGTIRQYIHRGKIASEKASNGRNKIEEPPLIFLWHLMKDTKKQSKF